MRKTILQRYSGLGPFEKFGVWAGAASIMGLLAALIPTGLWFPGTPAADLLVQTGTIEAASAADVSDPTYDVYYPVPYQSPPELTWLNTPYQLRILQQRPDGFRVQFTSGYSGVGPPRWQAKGLRKREQ